MNLKIVLMVIFLKIAFLTLGCKVNQYETEAMRRLFEERGYISVSAEDNPDVFVLNSCTVTAESDRKTRQTLRHFKRKSPNAVTVLCGCMAQAFPKSGEELKEADIVFGNTDHSRVPDLVEEFLSARKRIVAVEPHETGESYKTPNICGFNERTRAYMKIEDGCNRFCSYCAIPYARGRVRSKDIAEIKNEAETLGKNGYSEVVLVGINLSAYKFGEYDICDAVAAVAEIPEISRVRLGSLEPDHITDEMLEKLAGVTKFCPHFHLSLQSGCDETLKRMNRHYDSDFYFDLLTRIRRIFPDAAFTTDVMVGFVGETEEEFRKSLEFVRKCRFSKCHVFAYSKREGTAAARLEGHLQNSVKQRRSAEMIAVGEESQQEFLNSQIGSVYEVIFETLKQGYTEGYTKNYIRVRVKTDKPLTGETHLVKLISVENDYLLGEIL